MDNQIEELKKTDTLPYAVVKFIDDNVHDDDETITVSEIPTKWLCDSNTYCYWPTTKNVTSFISKAVEPNEKTWKKAKIVLEALCKSLSSARKKAEDMTYTSSEESQEKQKRKKKKPCFSQDWASDSEANDEFTKSKRTITPPPALDIVNIANIPIVLEEDLQTIVPITKLLPSAPKCDESAPVKTANSRIAASSRTQRGSCSGISVSTPTPARNLNKVSLTSVNNLGDNTYSNIVNGEPATHASNGTHTPSTPTFSDVDIIDISEPATPSSGAHEFVSGTSTPTSAFTMNMNNPAAVLRKILDTVTEIKLEVKELKGGIMYNPSSSNSANYFSDLQKYLPVENVAAFRKFNEYLEASEENRVIFIKFVNTIGGNGPKDNINRIYKRVYTNEMAVACSWLGQRNNVRVCDTTSIVLIKGAILHTYNMRENEFESISAEWFRHAKQRLNRIK